MKITHILWGLTSGGIETMLVNIINHQVKEHDVELLLVNDYYDSSLLAQLSDKCRLVRCKRKVGSRNPIPILKLNRHLLCSRPDIVHLHSTGLSRIIFVPCTMVRTIHNTNNPCGEYRKMRQLFSISKAVKSYTKSQGYESELVENGIPVGAFSQKDQPWEPNHPLHIVQIGRLDVRQKGQHILISSMEKLVKDYKATNLFVHFIGAGDDEQMLRQLVKDKGLEEYIIFEGVKPQDYLKGHLKDFDLLVQPSLYEGFGLTVAEALAAKVPVLVSDIEGPMEIIEDGKYGMAFHCNDADDLASSIRHILLHGYPQSMVEEARDMVCEKYDIAHTAEKYLQAYQEILSN